jgi:hypothetical protein
MKNMKTAPLTDILKGKVLVRLYRKTCQYYPWLETDYEGEIKMRGDRVWFSNKQTLACDCTVSLGYYDFDPGPCETCATDFLAEKIAKALLELMIGPREDSTYFACMITEITESKITLIYGFKPVHPYEFHPYEIKCRILKPDVKCLIYKKEEEVPGVKDDVPVRAGPGS